MLVLRGKILSVFVSREGGDAAQEREDGRNRCHATTVLSSRCRGVQKKHTGRSAQHLAITSLLKSTLTRLRGSFTSCRPCVKMRVIGGCICDLGKKGKSLLANFIFPKNRRTYQNCPALSLRRPFYRLQVLFLPVGRVGTSNSKAPPWVPFCHKFGISLK